MQTYGQQVISPATNWLAAVGATCFDERGLQKKQLQRHEIEHESSTGNTQKGLTGRNAKNFDDRPHEIGTSRVKR